MRKHLRLVTLIIPMVLVASNSYAAVKAGSSCNKVGSKSVSSGKSYTCVKSGKKMVWDNGVLIPVAQPSPIATATQSPAPEPTKSSTPTVASTDSQPKSTFTPWATSFKTEDMTLLAIANTSEFLGKVNPSDNYKFTVDPAIKESDRAWIAKELDYANGAWSQILQGQVNVFLGTTHDWAAKTLRDAGKWIGDPKSPYPCTNGVNDAYCAGPNIVLLVYSDIYKPGANRSWDVGRQSTPAHEFFHNVQYAFGYREIGPEDPTHMPRWLREGSANFFGYYAVEKSGLGTYESGRNQQVNTNPGYKNIIPLSQYDNDTTDPYGIGQAATEYLIASLGFEKFLNIWKFTMSEGSFVKGFKTATGIEINDFYSKFEAARGSMKIGTQ
jgi:hypothetical protein